jgi:hypothetical protein
VNIACGRNLAFFLRLLTERLQSSGEVNLDKDEEMLAYVSGDLQASTDNSWVWQGSETGTALNINCKTPSLVTGPDGSSGSGAASSNAPIMTVLTEQESKDWGGWEQVEWSIGNLINMRAGGAAQKSPYGSATAQVTTPKQTTPPRSSSTPGSSRISIANII